MPNQALVGVAGDIGNAFYQPEVNPAYGASQVTPEEYTNHLKKAGVTLPDNYTPPASSLWLTPDGKDVSHAVNNLGLSPNDPYIKPSMWQRIYSSTARETAAKNAAMEALPGQAGQARNIQRTNIGNDINTIPTSQLPFGDNTQANISSTINPRLLPSYLNPEVTAQTFAQGGGPQTLGQSDIIEAQNKLIGGTALQKSGNLWREQLDRAGNLQYDIGLNEAKLGALPNTQQTIGNQAAIEAAITGQGRADIPITTGTQRLGDVRANYLAGLMPDETVSTPYMSTIGINGVQTSGGSLNPNFRPPAAALMQSLRNGTYMGGANTGAKQTLGSTGRSIIVPPTNPVVQPTMGTVGSIGQSTPDYANNPEADLVPVDQYPDVVADRNSGRIYTKDGHDITNHPETAPIRQAVIAQFQQEHRDAREAGHDAAQATIAAKAAELKAEQKRLAAEHLRMGPLPQAGRAVKYGAQEVGNTLGDVGSWYGQGIKRGYNAASNYLIGE